jgi:hypothetical protein
MRNQIRVNSSQPIEMTIITPLSESSSKPPTESISPFNLTDIQPSIKEPISPDTISKTIPDRNYPPPQSSVPKPTFFIDFSNLNPRPLFDAYLAV